MITFEEYLNERVYKGLKADLTKGKKKVTEEELRELVDNRDIKALENIDVSEVTNMTGLFESSNIGSVKFNPYIGDWDVSNVIDMSTLFYDCEEFNQDLSSWDVSNVIDMNQMFDGCIKFNRDLSSWDVAKTKNMDYMFANCEDFNKNISSWDVSNVTTNEDMFSNCPIKEEYKPKFKDGINERVYKGLKADLTKETKPYWNELSKEEQSKYKGYMPEVKLSNIKELPFRFEDKFEYTISIDSDILEDLSGLPKILNGSLIILSSSLITLKDIPKYINGYLTVEAPNITELPEYEVEVEGRVRIGTKKIPKKDIEDKIKSMTVYNNHIRRKYKQS